MNALHASRMSGRPGWNPPATSVAADRINTAVTSWMAPATPNRRSDHGTDAGVHLPFIAPMLCGVRVRGSLHGLEFILPNPSGGRGVYVAAWSVVAGFAAPSLHDTLLVGRLSGRETITPADVRQAARSVALDGYAGHDATGAAQQAETALDTASLRLRAQFLLTLARRCGFHRPEDAVRCMDPDGFNMLAGRLGWRGPQLAEALELLSVRYASISVGGTTAGTRSTVRDGGRWTRLLSLVRRMRLSLAEEQFTRSGPDGLLLGRIILAADRCIQQAERLLPEIETMLADPLPLLEAWRETRGHGQGRDSQGGNASGWLHALETAFDGWDRICLLWFDAATPRLRQSVISEIASLARATGNGDGWSPPSRQGASGNAEDGPGAELRRKLVTRNERIRTRELTLELEAA